MASKISNLKTGNHPNRTFNSSVCALVLLGSLSACTSSGTSAIEVTGSIPPAPPAEIGMVQTMPPAQIVQAQEATVVAPQPKVEVASLKPEPRRASTIERPAKLHPKFGDYRPFHFPNRQPTDYAVHGTDTSRWQPEIHWGKVQNSGISFAFIKATEGGDVLDKSFHENFAKAKA
ncbi:MAG: GH25 family lysozyme, partial [Notoacmeibacter sp.]